MYCFLPGTGLEKLNSIYMEAYRANKDSTVISKLSWKAGRNFRILHIRKPRNGPEITVRRLLSGTAENNAWSRKHFSRLHRRFPWNRVFTNISVSHKELLYVGKAKNLRKRVSSYFNKTLSNYKTYELVRRIRFHRIHTGEF